jgi:hypothetical protein
MDSCIQLKELQEDGDNDDDDDGAEDLDDDEEEEDTEDDDEVSECRIMLSIFSKCTTKYERNNAIRIRRMMMCEKRRKRNSLKDMHWRLQVSRSRLSRKEIWMRKHKTLNWVNFLNCFIDIFFSPKNGMVS